MSKLMIKLEDAINGMAELQGIAQSKAELTGISKAWKMIKKLPTIDAIPVPDGGIGELSDGYHTFNGLYYQRMILFAALVKTYKNLAWKSHRHSNGELCFNGGWFIVGIDTPQGSYTYHYEDKYFDLFDCIELPNGKEWDGHTENDVTRLLTLDAMPIVRCKNCKHRPIVPDHYEDGFDLEFPDDMCPCQCEDGYYSYVPNDNWFCPNGEREE